MSYEAVPTAEFPPVKQQQSKEKAKNMPLLPPAPSVESEEHFPPETSEMKIDDSTLIDLAKLTEQSKPGEPQQNEKEVNSELLLPTEPSAERKPPLSTEQLENEMDEITPAGPVKKYDRPHKSMPQNKLRHCMCNNKMCRNIMRRWAQLKAHDRVGYLHVPEKIAKAKDTPTARHVTAFREGLYRYMSVETLGGIEDENNLCNPSKEGGEEDAKTLSKKRKQLKDERIAYCHFHPMVIGYLVKDKEKYMSKRLRWRIPTALAEEIGLKPNDMCPDPKNDEKKYFALPNYSLQAAMADVIAAEEAHEARAHSIQFSQIQLTKSISNNPKKYALEIYNLREENARLAEEVKALKTKLKQEHGARCKAEEKKHSVDRKLTKTKCRLEKIVEAKKTPVPKGRPPKTDPELNKAVPVIPMFGHQQLIPQVEVNGNSPYIATHLPPVIHHEAMTQQIMQPVPNMDAMTQQTQPLPNQDPYIHPNSALLNETFPNNLTTHDDKWEYRFRQLVEYRARFMSVDVPRGWAKNKALGKWVDNQRVSNKQGKLTQVRINRLSALGFIWDKRKHKLDQSPFHPNNYGMAQQHI